MISSGALSAKEFKIQPWGGILFIYHYCRSRYDRRSTGTYSHQHAQYICSTCMYNACPSISTYSVCRSGHFHLGLSLPSTREVLRTVILSPLRFPVTDTGTDIGGNRRCIGSWPEAQASVTALVDATAFTLSRRTKRSFGASSISFIHPGWIMARLRQHPSSISDLSFAARPSSIPSDPRGWRHEILQE